MPKGQSESDSGHTGPDSLQFSRVSVKQLYGIEHQLDVDSLCGDVNVIYGSNASGKTTLARALRMLLWPKHAEDHRPNLSARFTLGGSDWRVDLKGQTCQYQRDYQPASSPPLPPASHEGRYHLYLPNLIGATDGDKDFAQQILQEAQGGVDVEGAAEELGFEVPSRRKSKTATAVEELRQKVQEAQSAQEALREREHALDRLREELKKAREAAERADALEQARGVAEARRDHEKACLRLEDFPDVMGKVQGDEVETLRSHGDKKASAKDAIGEAAEAIEEAESTIETSIIPEEGLPDGQIETIRAKVSSLKDSERDLQGLESDLEGAREKERAAWTELSAGVDREKAAEIDLPTVEEIESHVEEVEEVQGQRQALERLERLLGDAAPEEPVDTLRDAQRALHRWLQRPDPVSEGEERVWDSPALVTLIVGVLVGGAGAVLLALGAGLSFWVGGLLVVLAAALVAAQLMGASREAEGEGMRPAYEKEYRKAGLEAPTEWDREAVEKQSDRLWDRLREAEIAAEKKSEWERLRPKMEELQERAKDMEEERERLARETGLDPDVSSRTLKWLVDRLSRWQAAREEVRELEASYEKTDGVVVDLRDRLNELLSPYDLDGIEDGAEAKGALQSLVSAQEEFRDAKRELGGARSEKERAEQDLREAEAEITSLYEKLGLEKGNEPKLRSLVEQHEDYLAAVEEEKKKRTVLETRLGQLRRTNGHEEEMEEASEQDLKRRLEAAREEAETVEEHLKEINEIENDIERARKEGTLEQLRAKYREKRDELARDRERDYEKAAGAVLADFVQEKTRGQGLPSVFERARDLFAEITNNRYELDLDDKATAFRAIDHVEDRGFPLDELSSGTKVQLLLSVRVAFVERQEQGGRVPLVLDETLATSDEKRAGAIIRAIKAICQSGRQVFYLTAQQDEVQKWKAGLGGNGGVDCQVVSLPGRGERERADLSGDGAAVPTRKPTVEIPDSEGATHEELRGLLEVPKWSPRQPVTQLHLWYLIGEAEPLIELTRSGVRTWGQLRLQHRREALGATPLDDGQFKRIQALAKAASSWKEAWLIGRGRPVDRVALEESGAVSNNFLGDVTDLAEDLGGDAEALLRALREKSDERAKGFYSSKADELEAYLREEGYVDRRDAKSQEEMWQYVLADLAPEREAGIVGTEALESLFERIQGPSSEDG